MSSYDQTIREEAIRLHSLGYNPVPLVPGGKRPAPIAWQTLFGCTPQGLVAMFNAYPGGGLGLLTGHGLLVLDSDLKDGVSGEATIARLTGVERLPPTMMVRTPSGGYHRYFRLPPGVELGNTAGKLGPGLDTRCEGGQVVAPPTTIAGMRPYQWMDTVHGHRPTALFEPAMLPPGWLARLQSLEASASVPPPARAGAEVLVSDSQRAFGLRRAAAYLAAMPPAISGQGGHTVAFDAACRAVERCYTREDALTALQAWNQRCQPHWEAYELDHKLNDAEGLYSYGSANVPQAAPAAKVDQPPAVVKPASPDDDELDRDPKDPVLEAAKAAYLADHKRTVEEDHPGRDVVDVLMRTVKPGTVKTCYLRPDFQRLTFAGMRPSRFAHDEHTSRPWRKRLDDGSWTTGATEASLTHELEAAGLNSRSATMFRQRVRHVADTLHVYDAPGEVFVERNGATFLNVYRKSLVEPEAGDWSKLRTILLNLHNGNEEYMEWTLDWAATVIRDIRAGKPQLPGVAVVFYGAAQGAGKGVFGEVMRALVGEHNFVTIRQADLDENFNGWAEGKLFICANEVFSSENRTQSESNKLKPYISDPTVSIRRMYAEVTARRNVSAWLFFSNDMRPVALERLDRRFTVFQTGPRIAPELGRDVADDAHAGGAITRAFLHELLTRDVSRFLRHTPLVTTAKAEVQYDTSNSADKFLAELTRGDGFDALTDCYRAERGSNDLYADVAGGQAVERSTFYEVYRLWARGNGYNALGSAQLFRLARNAGLVEERHRFDGRKPWFFFGLPGLPTEEASPESEHPNVQAARLALEAP